MRYACPAALAALLLPTPAPALDRIIEIAPFAEGIHLVLRESDTGGRLDVAVLAMDREEDRYRLVAHHPAILPLSHARLPYVTGWGEGNLGFRNGFAPETGLDGFLMVAVLPDLRPGTDGALRIVAIEMNVASTTERDRYGSCTIDYRSGTWNTIFRAGSDSERQTREGSLPATGLVSLEALRDEPWREVCADVPLPD